MVNYSKGKEALKIAIIQISIEDEILKEAEQVLNSVGLDVQMAISIFLRRVVIEKGFPMSVAASSNMVVQESVPEYTFSTTQESSVTTSTNTAITEAMVAEVWQAFIKFHKGLGGVSTLSDDIASDTGMNRGSALIYLSILSNLIKGEPNTRIMKMKDLEYFLDRIRTDLGEEAHQTAIQSLRDSVPYWKERLAGRYGDKIEALCDKHD